MRFRTRDRGTTEINLTPLIDVVFLLLIFFMVSTTFEHSTELSIKLPKANADAKNGDATIAVVVDSKGGVSVAGRRLVDVRVETLRRALAEAAEQRDTPSVLVIADAATAYQSIVAIMDAARQAGLHRLTFAAEQSQPPQSSRSSQSLLP